MSITKPACCEFYFALPYLDGFAIYGNDAKKRHFLHHYHIYYSDVSSVASPDFCRMAKEVLQLSILEIKFLK